MSKKGMKAKEYLLQISKIDRLIANKTAEKEYWQAVAESTGTYSEDERVQSSSTGQKMANAVVRYVTMQYEIDEELIKLINVKLDVIKTIEQLPTDKYDVLHKRYVQNKMIKEIAMEMGETESWVSTVHGRALQDVQRIIDKKAIICDKS